MTKPKAPATVAQLKPDMDQLRQYLTWPKDILPLEGLLIPLHHYKDKTTTKFGKVYDDGKRPVDKDWTRRRYGMRRVLEAAERDGINVGVRITNAFFVIDVDPRNGGLDSLASMKRELRIDLTIYPCVHTGGGGYHFYVRTPEGNQTRIRNGIRGWDGIEFKGVGRQVVAAGSIHPNGTYYKWGRYDG